MSHVKVSFDMPEYVANVDGMGTLRLLEAIRVLGLEKKTRIYQASTSELYGGMPENKNAAGTAQDTVGHPGIKTPIIAKKTNKHPRET